MAVYGADGDGTFRLGHGGGLAGWNVSGTLKSCYWDSAASGRSTGIGTDDNSQTVMALSTAAMKKSANFTGWDFASDTGWVIREDSTYPALRGVNNAPFAFADTLAGHHLQALLANDFDEEKSQDSLVYSIDSVYSYTNSKAITVADIVEGDSLLVRYRVGEVLASGDTLWGNVARSIFVYRLLAGTGTVTVSDKTYDGLAVSPTVTSETNGTGSVTVVYKTTGSADTTYAATAPAAAGSYTVKATFAATADYAAVTDTSDFTITQATVSVVARDTSKTYGSTDPTLPSSEGGRQAAVSWNLRASNGVAVPAGAYIWKMRITTTDGQTLESLKTMGVK